VAIRKLSLSLLQKPELTTPLLSLGVLGPGSLTDDLARAADPKTILTREALLNIICKYSLAFVHPGAHEREISMADLTRFFDQFANRRRGADSLEGQPELRRRLLDFGFALCMLLDLPKTGHILWDILQRKIQPQVNQETFFGLDIGAGTGVLMLGMWILARRSGFTSCDILGIERDERLAARADELLSELGIGRITRADAKKPGLFRRFCPRGLHFVANETLPSQGHRLWKEDFPAINERLFADCGPALAGTEFFPSAVYAVESRGGRKFRLSPENSFQPDAGYPLRLMRRAGIELAGEPVPLEAVGQEWRSLISPEWLPLLPHRW